MSTTGPIREKIDGLIGSSLQFGGSGGPLWSASGSGAFEAHDSIGALAVVRGTSPVGNDDLVPKGWVISNSLVFSNSNGVSFGTNGRTITASVAAQPQTVQPGIQSISAGTQVATTGQVVLANSNGVTFGLSNGTITASVSVPPGFGVAAGTQTASSGTAVFANGNGISFGMSGSSQITASYTVPVVPSQSVQPGIQSISAGTTVATTGNVVFANLNGLSFGLAGNTITGSYTVPVVPTQSVQPGLAAASAGTTSLSSGTIVFVNSNNVSFGMSVAGSTGTITASASYSQSTGPGAISAGTTLATSGTIIFSNLNGVTFGLDGQTLTASVAAGGFGSGEFLAAGTQTGTAATIVFRNSNNVTFGMGGNSQITASASYAPVLAFFENLSGVMFQGNTFATLSVVPLAANVFPGLMTASTFLFGFNGNGSQSASSGSMLFSFGIYTLNGSTLSLLNSVATQLTYGSVSNNSTAFTGFRWLSIHSSQWSTVPAFSQTNYWLGFIVSSSNATQSLNLVGQNYANAQARWGTIGVGAAAPAGSFGWRPMMGAYTATTTQFPVSIQQGDLNASFTNVGNFLPHVIMNAAMSNF